MASSSKNRAMAAAVRGVRVFEEALAPPLFERLLAAVQAIGTERLKRNYTTTFWFPRGSEPSNIAEECVVALSRLADPGPACTGMEWWLGRLRYGEKLRLHFDRDMTLRKQTGQFVHPLLGSVFYLNAFPTSPTVILEQIPSPDGNSRIPAKAERRQSVEAVPNRYATFAGNLRHGVIPDKKAALEAEEGQGPADMRLTFLVNYWTHRPLPPVCFDYDGSIYPSLQG